MRQKPPNASGMLRENIVTATLCFLVLSASERVQNSPVFEFQSRYIEHHFEARAMLPQILDVCVAAFCFAHYCLSGKFTKIILPNSEKSQQLNIGRKTFEEIFKKGIFFPFPLATHGRGMKSRFT